MTDKITLSRELVEELLDGFLDPRCTIAKAIQTVLDEPVPLAGGEVEDFEAWWATYPLGDLVDPNSSADQLNARLTWDARSAHVTRLQAEVERLHGRVREEQTYVSELAAEHTALQSELTKARELLADRDSLLKKTRGAVSYLALRADDIGNDNAALLTLLDLALSASAEPSDYPECSGIPNDCPENEGYGCGCSARAEQSAPKCETCHGTGVVDDGVITDCDGVPFENGPIKCVKDCPACSAQPAPVAVVMPRRQQVDPYVYDQGGNCRAEGWNACLDEVARLNSEPKS